MVKVKQRGERVSKRREWSQNDVLAEVLPLGVMQSFIFSVSKGAILRTFEQQSLFLLKWNNFILTLCLDGWKGGERKSFLVFGLYGKKKKKERIVELGGLSFLLDPQYHIYLFPFLVISKFQTHLKGSIFFSFPHPSSFPTLFLSIPLLRFN